MTWSKEFITIIKVIAFFTAIAVYIHLQLESRAEMRGLVLQQVDVMLEDQTERMIEDMKRVQIIDVQSTSVDRVLPDDVVGDGHSPIPGGEKAPASR